MFPLKAIYDSIPIPLGWFHVVLNFIGTNSDEGFKLYYDGVEKDINLKTTTGNFTLGSGTVVIGKRSAFSDEGYSSVMVDEMMLYNRKLTETEIEDLYNAHA